MKALLVPALILLSSVLAFGQIVVFPNRVTTVEKLPPKLRAYRDAARRLSGSSSTPCAGATNEDEAVDRANRALLLELEAPLRPFEYGSRCYYVRIEVLNKYPFLSEPPAVKNLRARIKKVLGVSVETYLLWFALGGKAFVAVERGDLRDLPRGELAWKPGDPMVSRLLAWSAWVKGKPDLCFEQAERFIEWPSEGDPPVCFFGDWGADILVPVLVSPEGLILACAACAEIDSPKVPVRVEELKFLAPCGSPFAKEASGAGVYAPDPDLNGVVLSFTDPVCGSNLWFLPAWGGKLQPLKTYKPKLPTSR